MSTAVDEETLLMEFLDEAVPCESYKERPDHEAEIYVKVSCPHCEHTVLWPTCRPCWVYSLVQMIAADTRYICKSCKKIFRLADNATEVGPVR
jgi:DNA-directed RNA polymerase subunit RPC12/RpoP